MWKTPLNPIAWPGLLSVDVPQGAIARHVAFQDDTLTVWWEVDENAPGMPQSVLVAGTGRVLNIGLAALTSRYLGTVHSPAGLVWHVYVEAP
jgi:hypothetical protein